MVLTRRQEQLIQTQNTPTPGGAKTTVLPDGRQLKSALKTRGLAVDDFNAVATPDDPTTTVNGDGVTTPKSNRLTSPSKRVRIHSGNNIVHIFQSSSVYSEASIEGDEQESHSRHGRRRRRHHRSHSSFFPTLPTELLALLAILTWMVSSSALIFLNKQIMVDKGFPFPLALVALTQIGSAFFGWAAGPLGLARQRPYPGFDVVVLGLMPLALLSAGCLFFGNFAYLGLSVAFINIMKALTPATTLLVGVCIGIERLSLPVFISTLLMAWGTGMATMQETTTNATHFSWLAFGSFLLSIVFEAGRVVFTERILSEHKYSPLEMTAHLSPLTFLLLAAGSFAFEKEGLVEWKAKNAAEPTNIDFAIIAAASFLVNISTFYAIRLTSGTTLKVAGCVKNVAVVFISLWMGDHLTGKQLQGFGLSIVGFLLYTYVRSASNRITYKVKSV